MWNLNIIGAAIVSIGFGLSSAYIARDKGYPGGVVFICFFVGVVFDIFGVIVVALLPKINKRIKSHVPQEDEQAPSLM